MDWRLIKSHTPRHCVECSKMIWTRRRWADYRAYLDSGFPGNMVEHESRYMHTHCYDFKELCKVGKPQTDQEIKKPHKVKTMQGLEEMMEAVVLPNATGESIK